MDAEQKKYEVGLIDDQGHEHHIDGFDLSIFAYGWCVKQDGRAYYKDIETGQRCAFKSGRLDIDLFG